MQILRMRMMSLFYQPIALHLSRNDYMIDTKDAVCNGRKWPSSDQLKQTEFNTIAVGCCGLSEKCYQVHRYIMKQAGLPYESDCMDENKPRRVFAHALLEAWKLYNVERSVILFIVMDEETNIFDQKMMEQAVFDQNPDVVVEFLYIMKYVYIQITYMSPITSNRLVSSAFLLTAPTKSPDVKIIYNQAKTAGIAVGTFFIGLGFGITILFIIYKRKETPTVRQNPNANSDVSVPTVQFTNSSHTNNTNEDACRVHASYVSIVDIEDRPYATIEGGETFCKVAA